MFSGNTLYNMYKKLFVLCKEIKKSGGSKEVQSETSL